MNNLTPDSVAVRLYAALEQTFPEDAVIQLDLYYSKAAIFTLAAEHERLCSERIAAVSADRDRWQQDSLEQARAINRLVSAAEERNIVDANKEAFFLERIAAAEKAARYQALYDARNAATGFSLAGCNSALEAVQKLLTAAEAQTGNESNQL
jgi:hypothetical protein